jgi:hypothetical protein
MSDSVKHFTAQQSLIKELFDEEDWLKLYQSNTSHPAIKRYQICQQMIEQGGVLKLPENIDILPELTSILLDNYIFAKVSGGNTANFSLGDFANYGDQKVRQSIASQLKKEKTDAFSSLMTELSFGAWFLSKNVFKLTATEDEGLADFKIDIHGHPIPIIVECKYINANTNETRYQSDIKKANKQIKKWKPILSKQEMYGIVVIDVSSKFLHISNKFEKIKNELVPEIKRLITTNYSSVSGVFLICDSFQISQEAIEKSYTRLTCDRRGLFIRHSNPIQPLPDNFDKSFENDWGYEAVFIVKMKDRKR